MQILLDRKGEVKLEAISKNKAPFSLRDLLADTVLNCIS